MSNGTVSCADLVGFYRDHRQQQQLVERLNAHSSVLVDGLLGSARGCSIAALSALTPLVCVASSEEEAGYLYSDLTTLLPSDHSGVCFFPSAFKRSIHYGHKDEAYEPLRADVIARLMMGEHPLVVTYPQALAESIPMNSELDEQLLTITQGDTLDREEFKQRLFDMGFVMTDYVYEPGQMVFRGSLVDLYSYHSDYPVRIDFFDDEVESLRYFNPEDQLSIKQVERTEVVPHLQPDDQRHSLFDLLDPSYGVVVYHWNQMLNDFQSIAQLEPIIDGDEGFQSADEMQRYLVHLDDMERLISTFKTIHYEAPSNSEVGSVVRFNTTLQPQYNKQFNDLIAGLSEYKEQGYELFLLSDVPSQVQRLNDIFVDRQRADLQPVNVPIVLHQGFEDADLLKVFMTDHGIFARFHKYSLKSDHVRSNRMAVTLKDLQSLNPGDYIVHVNHGVGQFAGLVLVPQESGGRQEMVKLVYRDQDELYVSLHSLHKLSKYRSKEDETPVLSKVGTGSWQRMKDRAKKKIKDIARDLIALYAARKESKGYAFAPDSYLQHELEASFIYDATPDQEQATADVKKDMESQQPMDRLVCGDVGFGKTEVAIRAAFKAVADSKQVALLVPTTILAYQHYLSFKERLADFPCRVDYLSRARKPKEVSALLNDLKEGKIDIVIGTHRLVGKDVAFKDLGLLIIDEEQKFGVAVKEKLRHLRVNVDTLTLSATPIPRTLQFSLMGARDLSNINTPPRNRQPVSTQLITFSKERIAEAINFELSRNGQVYYLHNRVADIQGVAALLNDIVPDARVAVAHGQMKPVEVERILMDFANHEFDILICTTIVENGIDISNANTIIIDDAQRYGLSDLHQLRGRVGRSNRKAFCYLVTPITTAINPQGMRRLKAIELYSDLGSGMRIAMQDLDIRGAGNMLGAEQSGFIADMGYDTYRRVFDEAVRELKMEEYPELFDQNVVKSAERYVAETLVETDMDLSFPPDYVPKDAERIALYQEIDNLETEAQTKRFEAELKDRFGAIPPIVHELLLVPTLRRVAAPLGVGKLVLKQGKMFVYFPDDLTSPFYQSEVMAGLVQYAFGHGKDCKVIESRGRRKLVVQSVQTVGKALERLMDMRSKVLTQ